MHNSDPSDIHAERPPLGDRVPRRPSPAIPNQTPAELDARDQAFEEADKDVVSWLTDYRESMTRAAVRAGADAHLAEDIVQDVILKMLERRRAGFVPDKPGGWLIRLMWTTTMSFHRRDRRRKEDSSLLDEQPNRSGNSSVDCVWSVIESLPSEHRDIVILGVIEGLKVRDIADALGLKERTTYRRIEKAMTTLQDRLIELCEDAQSSSSR